MLVLEPSRHTACHRHGAPFSTAVQLLPVLGFRAKRRWREERFKARTLQGSSSVSELACLQMESVAVKTRRPTAHEDLLVEALSFQNDLIGRPCRVLFKKCNTEVCAAVL